MQLQTPVILTIGLAVAMAIAATTPTALHSVTSALSFQNKYSYCDWRTGKAVSKTKIQPLKQHKTNFTITSASSTSVPLTSPPFPPDSKHKREE